MKATLRKFKFLKVAFTKRQTLVAAKAAASLALSP